MSTLGGSAPNTSVTFYGWATSASSTARVYTDGQSVTSLTATNGGTVKLYAIYSKTVTVTFNANGCTTANGSATGTIYNAGTTVSVTVPTASLNTSWKNLKASTSSTTDTASSGTAVGSALSVNVGSTSTTATAYYICNKTVTVTFNANNCTTAAKTATFVVKNGGTSGSVTVPSADMNSGWTTLGASSSASSTSQGTAMGSSMSISIGTSSSGTTMYYNCIKAAVTKSVTYSKGSNVSAIGATSGSCQVAAVYNGATQGTSCTVTLPSITANTGYTSVGWSTTNGATSGASAGNSYTLSASSTTLYANATANTYTIKYDYENNIYTPDTSTWEYHGSTALNSSNSYNSTVGVAVYSNTSLYTGLRIPINSDKKTSTNYELSVMAKRTGSFSGNLRVYATTFNSSGGVLSYNHGISIDSTLTANTWKKYSYSFNTGAYSSWTTIYIDYDTASQGPVYISDIRLDQVDSVSKTYGTTLGTLPTPTRTGYTFKGWYTAASGGTQISTSTAVPAANTTYYAQWTANTYTVYVDGNGGTIPSTSGWTTKQWKNQH